MLITIVDENNRVIGSAPRNEVVAKGIWHRIVVVLVFNTKGQIYIQKRAPHVQSSPNLWDHSAAGHVDAEEEPDEAAKRELKEELGIIAEGLKYISTYTTQRSEGDKHYNRYWYLYTHTSDEIFSLQEEEVAEGKFVDISWLEQQLLTNPDIYTDGIKKSIEMYVASKAV